MKKSCGWVVVIAALVAAPLMARQQPDEGFGSSRQDLVRTVLSIGGASIEVLAPADVAVDRLFAGLDRAKALTVEEIFAAVGEKRGEVYPDAPIGIAISPAPEKSAAPGKSALVKAIIWWYHANASGDYWYAQYVSGAAVVVIDAMIFGHFHLYDRIGGGPYIFRAAVPLGATRTTYGSKVLRGFMGVADGDAKGDVILYFFK